MSVGGRLNPGPRSERTRSGGGLVNETIQM